MILKFSNNNYICVIDLDVTKRFNSFPTSTEISQQVSRSVSEIIIIIIINIINNKNING